MPWKRRFDRAKSTRTAGRIAKSRSAFFRRSLFESLEDRRMLTGYFDTIADKVTGPAGIMASITHGLHTIDAVTRLPIINTPINQITQVTDSLESFRTDLDAKLRSFSTDTAQSIIQTQVFDLLGPLKVLRDRTGDGTVTSDDVGVTVGMSEVNFSLNLGITVNFQAGVGLGIDSVPFKPIGTPQDNQGGFTVSLTYDSFNFGFKNNAPYFDSSASERVAIQDRRLSAGDDDRRPGLFERRRHQQQAQRRRQQARSLVGVYSRRQCVWNFHPEDQRQRRS